MGHWSPECTSAEGLDGVDSASVGARFKGSNKHGIARWSTKPTVVVADRGKEFAFIVTHLGRDMTKWAYRFEAVPGGTRVTESFVMMNNLPIYYRFTDRFVMGVRDRKADLEDNMRRTLTAVKQSVESTRPAS